MTTGVFQLITDKITNILLVEEENEVDDSDLDFSDFIFLNSTDVFLSLIVSGFTFALNYFSINHQHVKSAFLVLFSPPPEV